MIFTVEELRALAPSLSGSDDLLRLRLEGIEQAIKGETNNDFAKYADETGAIQWPDDIKLGVLNLMQWDDAYRAKQGLASETISRHSVTYAGNTAAESIAGFPASMFGFVDPYRRARF